MKKFPNRELIEDISLELGVEPAFIEKDWYAVEILKTISTINDIFIIFTGGTSLSKAYGLIKRFSEDLDFRILGENLNRNQRRNFRSAIIEKLRTISNISINEDSIDSGNQSRYFSFNVIYPQHFKPPYALRPHLKLEFSFETREVLTEHKDIFSFISQFATSKADCKIKTIFPIETAADKFCALLWRIDIKNRDAQIGTKENDPTIIRHLHDLSALNPLILSNKLQFKALVKEIFLNDKDRGGNKLTEDIKALARATLNKFINDSIYEDEYISFVDNVSYAPEDEKITFRKSLNDFEQIISELF